jgi:hypothetical protein
MIKAIIEPFRIKMVEPMTQAQVQCLPMPGPR